MSFTIPEVRNRIGTEGGLRRECISAGGKARLASQHLTGSRSAAVLQCCSAAVLKCCSPVFLLALNIFSSAVWLAVLQCCSKPMSGGSLQQHTAFHLIASLSKAPPLVSFTDGQFCLTTWGEVGEPKIGLKDTLNVGNVFEHFHSAPNMDSSQRSVWSTESKDCIKRTPLKIIGPIQPKLIYCHPLFFSHFSHAPNKTTSV